MLSHRIILATLMVFKSVIATPVSVDERQEGPDGCYITEGYCYFGKLGVYTDSSCLDEVTKFNYECFQGNCQDQPGQYDCYDAVDLEAPYYVQIIGAMNSSLQVLYTEDQSCPPSGPGAVFATVIDNGACVQIDVGGSAPGMAIYPNGGGPLARRDMDDSFKSISQRSNDVSNPLNEIGLATRDGLQCNNFAISSSEPSESPSQQVSDIIDCTTGGMDACSITVGIEHTVSMSTSYSLMAGGGIEGIFEASTTFGMEYTDSTTTSLQSTYSVPGGQKGYLSAYTAGTLFTGNFTECNDGEDHPGQTLALKSNGVSYLVVITAA